MARRLHVERLVVLDDAHGLAPVDGRRRRLRSAPGTSRGRRLEEAPGLGQVVAAAVHGQGERLEPRRVHAEPQHGVVDDEEDRAAVDAAGEADADRAVGRAQPQPFGDLVARGRRCRRGRWRRGRPAGRCARGCEEAGIGRVGIGAADEGDVGDVMGGHHARVGRMELIGQPLLLEVAREWRRCGRRRPGPALPALGDEVAQRPADGAGHADVLAGRGDQGEIAVDAAHRGGIAGGDELPGLLGGHVEDRIAAGSVRSTTRSMACAGDMIQTPCDRASRRVYHGGPDGSWTQPRRSPCV